MYVYDRICVCLCACQDQTMDEVNPYWGMVHQFMNPARIPIRAVESDCRMDDQTTSTHSNS